MNEKISHGLENFVRDGLMYTEYERDDMVVCEAAESACNEKFDRPVIKVVGVGGAGNNIANRLYNIGLDVAENIAINTDKPHLEVIKADKKILVGKSLTSGLGAGGSREMGRRAAELAKSTLREILSGADVVFITAGMGGGTGTGAAPVVAQIAKEQGALVVALAGTPFIVERAHGVRADEGLADLRKTADIVVPFDNQILLKYVPNLPLEQAFSVMDQLIAEAVKGFCLSISGHSLVGMGLTGFEDVVGTGGDAVLLAGECRSQDLNENMVDTILSHPLNSLDYRGATGALMHVTGGPEMMAEDAEKIVKSLISGLGPDARVAWGASVDKGYEGRVRVIAIMTGIKDRLAAGDR